jgi:hypothetical protein
MSSQSPFGQSTSFGTVSSPFFTAGDPSISQFGTTAARVDSNALDGKNPRAMLIEFYQKVNPTKLADVDKLLAKYQGNYEHMFRNLAVKYNLDASVFGLTAVALDGYCGLGQSPPMGGTSTFGSDLLRGKTQSPFGSTLGFNQPASPGFGHTSAPARGLEPSSGFGTTTPLGGHLAANLTSASGFGQRSTPGSGVFGSATPSGGSFGSASGFGSTSSFGALASGSQPAFGGGNPAGATFGSPFGGGGGSGGGGASSTPFGAARR